MQLLYNRRGGDRGSVGAGVVRLLQGAGAIVSRQQRCEWLAGRVGAVVVVSRWSRRGRLRRRRGEGGSGDVEVASAWVGWVDVEEGEGRGRVRRVEVAGIVVVTWWVGLRQGEGGCGRVGVTSISGGRGSGVSRIAIG